MPKNKTREDFLAAARRLLEEAQKVEVEEKEENFYQDVCELIQEECGDQLDKLSIPPDLDIDLSEEIEEDEDEEGYQTTQHSEGDY